MKVLDYSLSEPIRTLTATAALISRAMKMGLMTEDRGKGNGKGVIRGRDSCQAFQQVVPAKAGT
ncbi:MAG: hypothetical protein WBH00_01600, partial [Xanthobacteraceae bacterium]